MLKALERNRKVLRQEVARRVNLKFAPDLRFRRDETFDEAERIDALLRDERVQRDLDRPGRRRPEPDRASIPTTDGQGRGTTPGDTRT